MVGIIVLIFELYTLPESSEVIFKERRNEQVLTISVTESTEPEEKKSQNLSVLCGKEPHVIIYISLRPRSN